MVQIKIGLNVLIVVQYVVQAVDILNLAKEKKKVVEFPKTTAD